MIGYAILLALVVATLIDGQPCAVLAGRVTDPVGDAVMDPRVPVPITPDLVSGSAIVQGSNLNLSVRYAPGTFSADTTDTQIFLDTDQNPATGNHLEVDQSIGLDYLLVTDGRNVNVLHFSSSGNYLGMNVLPLTFALDGIDVSVPLSTIGGSTKVNFKVIALYHLGSAYSGIVDFMPDIGLPPGSTCSPAGLKLTPVGLTFQAAEGGAVPPAKTFSVLTELDSLDWSVAASTISGGNWLQASPASGTTDSKNHAPAVQVTGNPNGLGAGSYFGLITVTGPLAVNSPQLVSVVLNISPPENRTGPQVDPAGLLFVATAGGPNPGTQTVQLSNVTNAPVTFTAAASASPVTLLSVQPGTGTLNPGQPATLTIQAKTAGLAAGVYNGTVTVAFSDGSKQIVTVAVIVSAGVPAPSGIRAATAVCTPKQLTPVITSLGANFISPIAFPRDIQVTVADNCGSPLPSGTVTTSFSNGDAPLSLIPLRTGGRWSGTWVPRHPSTATTTVTVKANQTNLQEGTATVTGNTPSNPDIPIVNSGGVVGAASYNTAPAPGTLVSIFGTSLSDGSASASQLPLDTVLKTTSAILNSGRSLPLIFTSTGQVNAVVPYDVQTRSKQQLVIRRGNSISVPEDVLISDAQPAVFTTDSSGKGQAHIYVATPDGKQILADPANPAHAGDYLVVYASGLGAVAPPVAAGTAAPGDVLTMTANPVTATIDGQPAQVAFAGLTPGFTGLYQINVVVPPDVSPGDQVPVVVRLGDQSSPSVTIAVR